MKRILLSLAALILAVPAFAVEIKELRVGTPYSDLPYEVRSSFVKTHDATYIGRATAGGKPFLVAFDVNDTGDVGRLVAYRLRLSPSQFEEMGEHLLGHGVFYDTSDKYFEGEHVLTRTYVARDTEVPSRRLQAFKFDHDDLAFAEFLDGAYPELLQSQVLGVAKNASPFEVLTALQKGGLPMAVPKEKQEIVDVISERGHLGVK